MLTRIKVDKVERLESGDYKVSVMYHDEIGPKKPEQYVLEKWDPKILQHGSINRLENYEAEQPEIKAFLETTGREFQGYQDFEPFPLRVFLWYALGKLSEQ